MSVVSNSSPLIALARIQRLDLVPTILQSALIPPAVAREIAPSVPVLPDWLEVRAPTKALSVVTSRGRLGDGEWEAIALAVELAASAIVIDDRPARERCSRREVFEEFKTWRQSLALWREQHPAWETA